MVSGKLRASWLLSNAMETLWGACITEKAFRAEMRSAPCPEEHTHELGCRLAAWFSTRCNGLPVTVTYWSAEIKFPMGYWGQSTSVWRMMPPGLMLILRPNMLHRSYTVELGTVAARATLTERKK